MLWGDIMFGYACKNKKFFLAIIFCFGINSGLLLSSVPSHAYVITFDDPGFPDLRDSIGLGVIVQDEFSALGITFSNTVALTAGISLNEIEFPPRSGDIVVANAGLSIMSLVFSIPVMSAGGFFTYSIPGGSLLLTAYDEGGNPMGQTGASYSDNTAGGFGDAGSSPNEFLQIAGVGPIYRLDIDGGAGSFSLDDFTAAVPEPSSLLLFLGGLVGIVAWKQRPV
jgi:hypothetical protein